MSFNANRLKLGKLVVTAMLNHGKLGLGTGEAQAPKALGNVIILHGTCDTGSGMKDWLNSIWKTNFAFPNYRVLYPSAPVQKYTPLNGQDSSVWFDRLSIGPDMPEDKVSLDENAAELSAFMTEESERTGISLEKTIIGGFSSGGIMALHLGYRFHPQLAGVFALSSFLVSDSHVYKELEEKSEKFNNSCSSLPVRRRNHSKTPTLDQISKKTNKKVTQQLPRLFMSQGRKDPLVNYAWGKETHKKLREHGVEGHFYTVPNAEHGIVPTQLNLLHDWIGKTIENSHQPKSDGKRSWKGRKYSINDECSIPVFER